MLGAVATRWLGVGLATSLAVITLALALTGRLSLYLNPDSAWFAVGMAAVVLVGAVASFALPLGSEEDHGHDHAHDEGGPGRRMRAGAVATVAGGVVASGVVVALLVTPAASLSADLAVSRDIGAAPLFAGADVITLAASGDTSEFGVGEWAGVFASATDPDAFDGDPVTLTGFVTPGDDGVFDLTRLVITHCVIDAQTASLPVSADARAPETGQWVTITGTVRADADGALRVDADEITPIDEPQDPYEY
ncbi:TIGR03943 family putative permease subunit [Microbacterium sp. RD1]|uniref:TIGR03943 family putative permease subunit n=1 Tax=Microbacterium sp. RD1 TaxID=3457313 RepID=UPI003FA52953